MDNQRGQTVSMLRVVEYLIIFLVFLLPLIVFPAFQNPFDTPKLAVLTLVVGLITLYGSVRFLRSQRLEVAYGSFDLPLLLLAGIYIVGAATITPNKIEALFLPGTASYIVLAVIVYFVVNQLGKPAHVRIRLALVASAVVFSLINILSLAGFFASLNLPLFIKQNYFNTLGNPLLGLTFLAPVLPFAVYLTLRARSTIKKLAFGLAGVFIVFGILINGAQSLPGRPSSPIMLDFSSSWDIAVDAVKENPLFGVGPGNYLTAFNRFRPASFNLTDDWSLKFGSARSYFLTIVTEGGLLALGALLLIGTALVRRTIAGKGKFSPAIVSAWFLVILMLLFPSSLSSLVLLFILLALVSKKKSVEFSFPVVIPAVGVLAITIFALYRGFVFLVAENTYFRGLIAVGQNDGAGAYELLRVSIQQNPYSDRYRSTYAQVNLALANTLAAGEEITDEQRQTISQLVQQAIREGKAVVSLNPNRAGNWELLASTYRTIIPLAKGADQFAVQTYNQAIALDPLNVNYRIALGGILYAAGEYEAAIDIFKLAVITKPDHANAVYNLAMAYKEAGKIDQALSQMSIVLSLVDRDSQDYAIALTQFEELQKGRKVEAPDGEELSSPGAEIEEQPALEPQLELPQDAEPNATPLP